MRPTSYRVPKVQARRGPNCPETFGVQFRAGSPITGHRHLYVSGVLTHRHRNLAYAGRGAPYEKPHPAASDNGGKGGLGWWLGNSSYCACYYTVLVSSLAAQTPRDTISGNSRISHEIASWLYIIATRNAIHAASIATMFALHVSMVHDHATSLRKPLV